MHSYGDTDTHVYKKGSGCYENRPPAHVSVYDTESLTQGVELRSGGVESL